MLTADLKSLPAGPFAIPMRHSDATAIRLLKRGPFGADAIRFPPGGAVPDHVHPGGHILLVLSGAGWVDYEGAPHPLSPGLLYLIPGGVRHGIRADTALTLVAFADDHRDAASEDRLDATPVASAHAG